METNEFRLSNKVADPSTVNVRIENDSTIDLRIDENQRDFVRNLENRRHLTQTKSEASVEFDQKFSSKREKHRFFREQQMATIGSTSDHSFGKERRSQSMVRQYSISSGASPTIPLVSLSDDVLLGSIRALQNERQLCKLSVEYLIDATNMRPDELARKANLGAPLHCHCGQTHSRCTLTLEFNPAYLPTASTVESNSFSTSFFRESNRTPLDQLFSAVNRFIRKAQQENKRVLIYGFEMNRNSPLAVIGIQYLMVNNDRLSLAEATQRVHRLFPSLPVRERDQPTMEKRFHDYLKQLDKRTYHKSTLNKNITVDGTSASGPSTITDYRSSARDSSWDSPETTTTNIPRTSLSSSTTVPPMLFDRCDSNAFHFRCYE